MNKLTRRTLLAGGGAITALAALGIAGGGTTGFLRRVTAEHFGKDALKIDGIDAFIDDYTAVISDSQSLKKRAAEVYFSWRGDRIYLIPDASNLKERFLQTILTRSNIIAMRQGRSDRFDYSNPAPWEPDCGLYLSAFAEDNV
ncbi:hypothetical protein AAD018_000785 [Aestuariibius insulae]|uniref:hypothetical protein n=1 Tax=Aestuariibius insulae TaxID=2058287 RepID=UPI00345E2DB1